MSAKHTVGKLSKLQTEALQWLLQYGLSKRWDWSRFVNPASVQALTRRGLAQWVTLASGETALCVTGEGRSVAMRAPRISPVVDDFGNLVEVAE